MQHAKNSPSIQAAIQRDKNEAGVTLIEVLIAVIILSVGLLGIAGLQVATAKFRMGSNARAATANLYSDYTDRVRLNPSMAGPNAMTGITDPALSSATNNSLYAYQATWATQQSSITLSTACDTSTSAACSPSDRATSDMLAWRKRVRDGLPQGSVYVQGNRQTGIAVTLMWFDKDNTDKQVNTNDGTSNTTVNKVSATNCEDITATTGMSLQTCCPRAAAVPAGVRCVRFFFIP
jgi:type IV pilus assembly protein PilV